MPVTAQFNPLLRASSHASYRCRPVPRRALGVLSPLLESIPSKTRPAVPSADNSAASSAPAPSSSRWLPDIKARVGRCIGFGLRGEEITHAGRIGAVLGREWRGLTAGAEGFSVDERRLGHADGEGLEGRLKRTWVEGVRWGDMVSPLPAGFVNTGAGIQD